MLWCLVQMSAQQQKGAILEFKIAEVLQPAFYLVYTDGVLF